MFKPSHEIYSSMKEKFLTIRAHECDKKNAIMKYKLLIMTSQKMD